ncbi:unnamed protein product [Durusdinium trenchii]|uniref:CCHC-type domain-containing protein n=1 Tax=Durusdinium trenchii TaxID=1381693 RepID=A0ABP0HPY0_9DINO
MVDGENQEVTAESPLSPGAPAVRDTWNKPTGEVPSGVPSIAGGAGGSGSGQAGSGGGKISTTYPPIFYARPGESWEQYWRTVTFWLASEGKSLPVEMRGPRLMQQLRERAGKIVQHLTVDEVTSIQGVDIIKREMEKSPIIRLLDNKKIDKRRQKFMKLARLPNESIESFINRAEIYRRENEASPAYRVGSCFYVGHLLDSCKLTRKDLALLKAACGGDIEDETKVISAMLELAEQFEGAPYCPIGRGEPQLDNEDQYLVQKPGSSSSASTSVSDPPSSNRRRPFPRARGGGGRFASSGRRRFRDALVAILEEDGDEDVLEETLAEVMGEDSVDEDEEKADNPGEMTEFTPPSTHDTFVTSGHPGEASGTISPLAEIYAQELKARNRVREIKKMRQYFQKETPGGPTAARGEHVKKWVAEQQKKEPCFICHQLGHWSQECPYRRRDKNVHAANVTFPVSPPQQQDWALLESLAASGVYMGTILRHPFPACASCMATRRRPEHKPEAYELSQTEWENVGLDPEEDLLEMSAEEAPENEQEVMGALRNPLRTARRQVLNRHIRKSSSQSPPAAARKQRQARPASAKKTAPEEPASASTASRPPPMQMNMEQLQAMMMQMQEFMQGQSPEKPEAQARGRSSGREKIPESTKVKKTPRKAAVETEKKKWRRNPRWIMWMQGNHIAALWGTLGAAAGDYVTANDDHELFHSELKDTLEVSDGDFSAEGDGTGRAPVKHTLNRRQRRSIEQGVQRAIRAHNKLYDVLDAKSAEVGRWTLLEVFAGKARLSTRARQRNACWDVLPPQDILSGGLDLLDAEHIELLKDVIRAQEPDVITLAPPSNPWSAWQRLRKRKAALRELRRQHLPFWNLVAWCWQVQNATGGLVVLEQPAASEALRLPMMTQRQNVHQRVVHMCRMGMKDRISHMPHKKPTAVQLNHEAINTPMFPEMTCDCAPGQHQPIEGSVRLWNPVEGKYQQIKRSTLAAEWPEGFCDWLLNGLEALREESAEVTLEVHQHTPSSRIWEAVPVEVEATPEGQLRQQMNILDGHHRYDYISFLGVSANLTKKIKNLQTRVAGYSPMQLIFGKEVSVPGNLMEAIAGQFHFKVSLATGDEIEATKVTKEALQQLADQLKQGRVNAELIPTHEEVEAREGGEQVRDAPPSRASAPDPRYPAMTLSDDEQEPSDDDVGPEELKKATSVLDDLPMSVAAKIRKKGDLEERRSTKRRMSPTELEESSIRATVASSSAVDPAMQTVRQKRDFYETAFRTTQEHLKKMKTKLEKKSALMMEPVVPAAVADRSEACENGESEEATGSEPVYSPYTSEDSNQTMASISSPFIEVDMFEEPWQREGEVTDYSAKMPEHEVHVTDMASECQPLDYDHDVHPAGWRADGFRRAEVLEAYRKGQLNTGQTRMAGALDSQAEDVWGITRFVTLDPATDYPVLATWMQGRQAVEELWRTAARANQAYKSVIKEVNVTELGQGMPLESEQHAQMMMNALGYFEAFATATALPPPAPPSPQGGLLELVELDSNALQDVDKPETGKVRLELQWNQLSPAWQAAFEQPIIAALHIYFEHDALEPVMPEDSVHDSEILPSRFVLVNKSDPKNTHPADADLEEAKLKARLVIAGHRDQRAGDYATEAPTATLLAHNFICFVAAQYQWKMYFADISAAFLQGDYLPEGRRVFLKSPTNYPLFVRQFICSPVAEKELWPKLKGLFTFGDWVHPEEFTKFCGRWERQLPDGTVEVQMNECAKKVKEPPSRSAFRAMAPLMPNEKSWIGAIIGQLNWLARQARADLLYGCSRIQQLAGTNDPAALQELKVLVERAREPHTQVFKKLGCGVDKMIVLGVSDASFAGMPRGRSQGGSVLMLANPLVLEGAAPVCVIACHSGVLKRVVRSSLAAEISQAATTMEEADYLRAFMAEALDGAFTLRGWLAAVAKWRQMSVLDSRTGYDLLNGSALGEDKRLAIDVAAMRQALQEDGASRLVRWVPGEEIIADDLTKLAGNGRLMRVMSLGSWALKDTESAKKLRADAAARKRAFRFSGLVDRLKQAEAKEAQEKENCAVLEDTRKVESTVTEAGRSEHAKAVEAQGRLRRQQMSGKPG